MCVSSRIHVYTCMHTYLWYMYMIGCALLCIYGVQARGWCILGHFLGIFWHFRPYFMTGCLKSRAHCLHCPGWICKSTSPLDLPAPSPASQTYTMVTDTCCYGELLQALWGSELRSPCLHTKHFTHQTISLVGGTVSRMYQWCHFL